MVMKFTLITNVHYSLRGKLLHHDDQISMFKSQYSILNRYKFIYVGFPTL